MDNSTSLKSETSVESVSDIICSCNPNPNPKKYVLIIIITNFYKVRMCTTRKNPQRDYRKIHHNRMKILIYCNIITNSIYFNVLLETVKDTKWLKHSKVSLG